MVLLPHHRGEVGGDRAGESEPGEDGYELSGQCGEDHHDRAGEGPADQVEHAIGDPRDIAPGRVLMGIPPCTQRGGDGRNDDGDAAEKRHSK